MSDLLQGSVVIDTTRQYRRVGQGKMATGIDKVDLAYIHQYRHQARALLRLKNRWYILTADDSAVVFNQILKDQPLSKLHLLQCCLRATANVLSQQAVLINTSHSGLEQPDYAQKVKKHFKKAAFFLHDIIPMEYPEYCKEGEQFKHQQRVKTILQSGDLIIANSQDTLNKLNLHTQNLQGFGHIATIVAMLGMPPKNQFETFLAKPKNQSFAVPMPYFVILGTIEPRKNHLLLLQVWRRLAETLQEKCPKLYIIGKRGWDIEQVIDILERAPFAKQTIVELSDACDQQVADLLKHASALLFPSFVEGFGLPLVQALQLSTPVIASDLAVFKEIADHIPDYVDPVDVMTWIDIITNYTLRPNELRVAQLSRLAEFQPFSWEQHFNVVTPQINTLF